MKLNRGLVKTSMVAACWMLFYANSAAIAQMQNPWAGDGAEVSLLANVQPFVELELLDPALLALSIPPAATSGPGTLKFRVTGNASATVTATPSNFIEIPAPAYGGFMGKAVHTSGNEEIGYNLILYFPRLGPGVQIAALTGADGVGTSPLSVDLTQTGGVRDGELLLQANTAWTPHGGIPAYGLYVGEVTITVTADSP